MNKKHILNEINRFIYYTIFFAIILFSFTLYQRLLLKEFHLAYIPYAFGLVKAMVLAKVIVLGQHFKIDKRYSEYPLIIPVCYQAFLSCLILFIITVLEHIIREHLIGIPVTIYGLVKYHLWLDLANSLIMFFIFFLFFSITETGRVLGNKKLFKLFFKSRTNITD